MNKHLYLINTVFYMNIVNELIAGFSKQELREFKYFLGRRKSAFEREDHKVIEMIRKGTSDLPVNSNAVHQTRKRLKKHLEIFIVTENYRLDAASKIRHYIDISKYLAGKNSLIAAWDYLLKASAMAEELEEYELLDFIYYAQISFLSSSSTTNNTHSNVSIPDLLDKRERNLVLARIDGNANAAYAMLLHQIKEQFSIERVVNMDELVRRILNQYQLEEEIFDHPRIYCKVVNIVCRALRETKDYPSLKAYSMKHYQIMKQKKLLAKIPDEMLMELYRAVYHSTVRTCDYKNGFKFQGYYTQLKERFKNQLDRYTHYDLRAEIMIADLYLLTNKLPQARTILLALNKKYSAQHSSPIIYFLLRINLLALHFKHEEYAKCIAIFNIVIQKYEKKILKEEGLGIEMLFYTEIYGVLFYYEQNDLQYAEYLLKRLKRKYAATIKDPESKREKFFIRMLEKMINEVSYTGGKKFISDYNKFVKMKEYTPVDKEYISLNAWLTSKFLKKKYYPCFLELVTGA
jgi:hypothetical protein